MRPRLPMSCMAMGSEQPFIIIIIRYTGAGIERPLKLIMMIDDVTEKPV